jgi:hypothetical protein
MLSGDLVSAIIARRATAAPQGYSTSEYLRQFCRRFCRFFVAIPLNVAQTVWHRRPGRRLRMPSTSTGVP